MCYHRHSASTSLLHTKTVLEHLLTRYIGSYHAQVCCRYSCRLCSLHCRYHVVAHWLFSPSVFLLHRYRCGCSPAGLYLNTPSLLTVHSILVVLNHLTLLVARLTAGAHRTRLFTGTERHSFARLISILLSLQAGY